MSRSRRVRLIAAALVLVVVAAACEAAPGDFTGDRMADPVYVSYGTGDWFTSGTATPLFTGQPGELAVAGDYNGDLKWEPAVLRGTTWISSALADPVVYDPPNMPAGPPATPGGANASAPPTLLPVPGDYDGTGKTVPAYYDQVDATWWIMGHANPTQFGIPPTAGAKLDWDVPVPADYDGDGHTDIAVFRPSDGSFHYLSSKTGHEVVLTPPLPSVYGILLPVPGTYDGLGHAQAAVTDGQNWYVDGDAGVFASFPFTSPEDQYLPAPAAYDGANKTEPAMIDTQNGVVWHAGQPRPPQTGTNNPPDSAAVFPTAVLVNIVRLTLYAQCLLSPSSFPGRC